MKVAAALLEEFRLEVLDLLIGDAEAVAYVGVYRTEVLHGLLKSGVDVGAIEFGCLDRAVGRLEIRLRKQVVPPPLPQKRIVEPCSAAVPILRRANRKIASELQEIT